MKHLLLIFIFHSVFSTGPVYAQFAGGSGREEDPWQVETIEQLQLVREYPDSHYVQIADIDASETAAWNDGKGFDPIGGRSGFHSNCYRSRSEIRGRDTPAFTGSYDGEGHVITGLSIQREEEDIVGLFGYIRHGSVTQLTLEDVDIKGRHIVGALVGSTSPSVEGEITHVRVSGQVKGQNYTGGLVGSNSDSFLITRSETFGSVSGEHCTGGLAGAHNGRLFESGSQAEVTGLNWVGGLVGWGMSSGPSTPISSCYATGNVKADTIVGGLVGFGDAGIYVSKSYATGDVHGNVNVGGSIGTLAFSSPRSNQLFATGRVTGEVRVAGLVGGESIVNSYWDTEATGMMNGHSRMENHETYPRGLPTERMQGKNAYKYMHGLDFEETWQLVDGGYPVLHWQQVDNVLDELPQVALITLNDMAPGRRPIFPEYFWTFEETEVHEKKSHNLRLGNPGNQVLEGSISISGPDADQFEVSADLNDNEEGISSLKAFTLEPDSTLDFEVTFSPQRADSFTANLNIEHNAANDDPFELKMTSKASNATFAQEPEQAELPGKFRLYPNHPNPFNPVTVIRYELPMSGTVRLEVFDVTGRRITTLVDEPQSAGVHEASWDASNAASGLYIYRITAGDFVQSRAMMLVK